MRCKNNVIANQKNLVGNPQEAVILHTDSLLEYYFPIHIKEDSLLVKALLVDKRFIHVITTLYNDYIYTHTRQ